MTRCAPRDDAARPESADLFPDATAMNIVHGASRRLQSSVRHAGRTGIVCALPLLLQAQRPSPPKDWTIDTAAVGTVTVSRKGGMMSSASSGKLLGPYSISATETVMPWFNSAVTADIASMGILVPAENDVPRTDVVEGQRVLTRPVVIKLATGQSRYVSYRIVVPASLPARVWIMRVICDDVLTFARVVRGGMDALMPYAITPPATLAALGAQSGPTSTVVTSFVGNTPRPFDTTAVNGQAAGGIASTPLPSGDPATDILAGTGAGTTPVSTPVSTPPSATASATVPSTPATTTPARVTGQYVLNLEYRTGGVAGVYKQVAYLLRSDGVAIEAPDVPPDLFNEAAAKRARPNDFYTWQRGPLDSLSVTDSKGARATWAPPVRGWPATRGQRLSLTYRGTGTLSTPDMTTSTVSASEVYAFKADGTFSTDAGVLGTGSSGGTSTTAASTRRSGGTYELDGYSITLRYRNGKVERRTFFFGSEAGRIQTDVVCIGGSVYYGDT
jgi:hypothetical protein